MIRRFRTYPAIGLLVIFCSYYAGITLFSHTHISHGSSIVHSHLGGGASHDHSDSQYAVIDILSNFQSECAVDICNVGTPYLFLCEPAAEYASVLQSNDCNSSLTLRGPPQA